jgi:hypothetical protein
MTANVLLEDSLERLTKKLNELMVNHATELQPICTALTNMTNRGMDADGFRRDLKELADAVITVRKASGAPPLFRELPVPPYDLWLPFKAADLTPADALDLSEPAQILNHKVTAMAIAIGCEGTSCEDGR